MKNHPHLILVAFSLITLIIAKVRNTPVPIMLAEVGLIAPCLGTIIYSIANK